MSYNYKSIGIEVKDVDKKQGIVSGYFSAFNSKDADGDIIKPGAFTKSINDWFPKGRIKHLLNHNPSHPLGVIMDLKEDDYGLKYTSKIGSHSLGQDFIKMVDSGLIKEHSIGFQTIQEGKSKEEDANIITEVKLYEGSSLTAWGANENTPITDFKGYKVEDIDEEIKKFEKFIRNIDLSDNTVDLCMIYIKQLAARKNSTQAVETPEPQNEGKLTKGINYLIIKHFS
jgi:HK97 family phage prohead protease